MVGDYAHKKRLSTLFNTKTCNYASYLTSLKKLITQSETDGDGCLRIRNKIGTRRVRVIVSTFLDRAIYAGIMRRTLAFRFN